MIFIFLARNILESNKINFEDIDEKKIFPIKENSVNEIKEKVESNKALFPIPTIENKMFSNEM